MATNTLIPKGKQELKREALGNSKLLTFAGLNSQQIAGRLQAYSAGLLPMLKSDKKTQRHIQIIATTVRKNQQLMSCSISSIAGGMLQAGMLNLDFNPNTGYCYLVPYYNKETRNYEAQFQLGYRGMIELINRSGEIKELYAECVYKGDEFTVEYGLNRSLSHVPKFGSKSANDITFVYAVAKTKSDGLYFVILTRPEIEKLRMRSPMQKETELKGAWKTDYEAMAKAKAIKQLAKFLPMSTDINEKIFTDANIIRADQNNELEYINEYEAEALNEIEEADAVIVADDVTNENTETPKNVNLETGELYE